MVERDNPEDDLTTYGEWPWLAGALFSAGLVAVLFLLAKGFS